MSILKPEDVAARMRAKWADLGLPAEVGERLIEGIVGTPATEGDKPTVRISEPLRPWDADDLANLEEIIDESSEGTAALLQEIHRQIALRLDAAERGDPIKVLVQEQACDDGLWFMAETCAEAYLQQELRRLHALIEERIEVVE